jgi:hypothetical protein
LGLIPSINPICSYIHISTDTPDVIAGDSQTTQLHDAHSLKVQEAQALKAQKLQEAHAQTADSSALSGNKEAIAQSNKRNREAMGDFSRSSQSVNTRQQARAQEQAVAQGEEAEIDIGGGDTETPQTPEE